MDKEYSTIIGNAEFCKHSAKLAFGADSSVIAEGRYAITQTISGTGALRVCGEFLNKMYPYKGDRKIYVPKPTWGNHLPIMRDSGVEPVFYTYYDPETKGLDFDGMMADLAKLDAGDVVMFHACAHNPTGVDPLPEQWSAMSAICKERGLFPIFDMAYQGFASGNTDFDATALRQFVADGHNPMLCQSYAKNMGLYGERIGAFTVVTESAEEAKKVESQLKILIRPMYSNPPVHGARLAATVMGDAALNEQWLGEVKTMADRIITMRADLKQHLTDFGSVHNWDHVVNQIGMFCFTGMTPAQVDKMAADWSIYLTQDGRISIAGVSSGNVKYLAEAMHDVTK
jgi:aspartate aminotransferase